MAATCGAHSETERRDVCSTGGPSALDSMAHPAVIEAASDVGQDGLGHTVLVDGNAEICKVEVEAEAALTRLSFLIAKRYLVHNDAEVAHGHICEL